MSPMHRTAVLLASLALVAACDRSPRSPFAPPEQWSGPTAPSLSVDLSDPDAMQSVTGFWQFVGINTGNDFKYAISAIRHADGSVSGEFEERVLDPSGAFLRHTHGYVTCFTIVGNTARIGGVLDQVDDPSLPGLMPGAEFRVNAQDNGPASSDVPDQGSNARFGDPRVKPGYAQSFCDSGTPFNLEPVQHGNITIKP